MIESKQAKSQPQILFQIGDVEKNYYLGVGENYAEAVNTYRPVREEAGITIPLCDIPLYDPEVFERYPGGRIA